MRAKAARGESTFAVTANVSEAHRQVPLHPQDGRLLGYQVRAGGDVSINTMGTFGVASASCYWSPISARETDTIYRWHDVAYACRG